jgi:hypothetical protein
MKRRNAEDRRAPSRVRPRNSQGGNGSGAPKQRPARPNVRAHGAKRGTVPPFAPDDLPSAVPAQLLAVTPPAHDAPGALLLDTVAIADLVPDPENRRRHPDRNVALTTDALRAVGAGRSIVVDESNTILAGNGVVAAAPAAGITRVRVVDATGDELIAVRRRNLTPDQKRALALYDNRAGELAAWNVAQLKADDLAGLDLTPFFDTDDLIAFGVREMPAGGGDTGAAVTVDQCAVIVLCKDEGDQRQTYDALVTQGYTCKVVNT